jgi:predicted Fe-Mo cluster-binding NifX family protein
VKIIISSQGLKLDSAVDPRFGRAAQFILYDTETASYEAISNAQSLDAAQGAGIKAAETISRLGAQVLITGHCGPKAFETLKAAGIEVVIGAEGCTVSQALEKYKSGQLKTSGSSDVAGHWQ